MQNIGFILILIVVLVLAKAYQDHKGRIKKVKEANLDDFKFEYELVHDFGKVTSTKKQVVFDVSGKKAKITIPFNQYDCWLTLFDDDSCVNFFFYEGKMPKAKGGMDSIDSALAFLEKQNVIIR